MRITKFKLVTGIITLVLIVIIMTRPCIFHPFSSHTAWEWGYYEASGKWPDSVTLSKYGK